MKMYFSTEDSKVNYIDLASTKCSFMIDDTYTWSVSKVGATLKSLP